jgi:hypothetical protein
MFRRCRFDPQLDELLRRTRQALARSHELLDQSRELLSKFSQHTDDVRHHQPEFAPKTSSRYSSPNDKTDPSFPIA